MRNERLAIVAVAAAMSVCNRLGRSALSALRPTAAPASSPERPIAENGAFIPVAGPQPPGIRNLCESAAASAILVMGSLYAWLVAAFRKQEHSGMFARQRLPGSAVAVTKKQASTGSSGGRIVVLLMEAFTATAHPLSQGIRKFCASIAAPAISVAGRPYTRLISAYRKGQRAGMFARTRHQYIAALTLPINEFRNSPMALHANVRFQF